MEMFFILLMAALQWLSIWHGVSVIDKKDQKKRKYTYRQTFITMGLPSLIGLAIAFILLFTPIPNYVSIITYIVLSVVFAFNGKTLYEKIYHKNNTKKKSNKKK